MGQIAAALFTISWLAERGGVCCACKVIVLQLLTCLQ